MRKDIKDLIDSEMAQKRYLHIDDPDVIDVLGRIEGERWARHQRTNRGGNSVLAFQDAYRALQDDLRESNMTPEEYEGYGMNVNPQHQGGPSSDGMIYGESGWSRYIVRPNGEVVLLARSTRPGKVTLAKQNQVRVAL